MLVEQFTAAITAARSTAALDNTARLLWRAHAEGHIADADAEGIAGAVQARRAAFSQRVASIPVAGAAPVSARRKPARSRSPDRQASLERRRRCAASGIVPARIAASFTGAEIAVLSIIGAEVRKSGVCLLPLDKIAALAGAGRTSVQNAIRLAEKLGLILRIERRRRGLPSLTNILRIVAPEWLAWLQHGRQREGFKKPSPTNNKKILIGKRTGTKQGVLLSDALIPDMFSRTKGEKCEHDGKLEMPTEISDALIGVNRCP